MWTAAFWKLAMTTLARSFVVFDEEDVGGAFAVMKDAAQFGEEELFVEGLLHPALGVAGELGAQGGGENAEDDDGNVGGGGIVAEMLERLPAAEAGHVEIEEDGFDLMLGGEDERLFAGDGFDDGVALTVEVLGDDGADAGVVVADQDGAFATRRERGGSSDVAGAAGAGKHDVERGSEAEVALGPDGAASAAGRCCGRWRGRGRCRPSGGRRRARPAGSDRRCCRACRWGCRGLRRTTLSRMESEVASVWMRTVEAAGENLMALESRLVRT